MVIFFVHSLLEVYSSVHAWYCTQQMQVQWGSCLSDALHVSNGVWQDSVLSPVLFAVYLDSSLAELNADDIVLLAPALRTMLGICNSYAVSHGLRLNYIFIHLLSGAEILGGQGVLWHPHFSCCTASHAHPKRIELFLLHPSLSPHTYVHVR